MVEKSGALFAKMVFFEDVFGKGVFLVRSVLKRSGVLFENSLTRIFSDSAVERSDALFVKTP